MEQSQPLRNDDEFAFRVLPDNNPIVGRTPEDASRCNGEKGKREETEQSCGQLWIGNEDGDLCWSSGRFLGEEEESLARSRRGKFRGRSFQATVKKTGAPLGVGHCKAVGNETRRGRGWRIAVDGAKWKRRN